MTLEEFYAERLSEDEIRAKAALGEWDDEAARYEWEDLPADSYVHARNHDPARVLREVEVKRRRLERYVEYPGYDLPDGVQEGRDPDERERDQAVKDALEHEVLEDATVWCDHPDYGKWNIPE